MNKHTLSIHETAWNMYQAKSTINQICSVIKRHRSTVYRWLAQIEKVGIEAFVLAKQTAKHRRPRARTPKEVIGLIIDVRNKFKWCGAKIRKELLEKHGISLSISTIYRWLHRYLHKSIVGFKGYRKHKPMVQAFGPRQVVEHDTVDLGGNSSNVYAYTAIDVFTKEPSVVIASDLKMKTGAKAFTVHHQFYGQVGLHQSDNGYRVQVRLQRGR